MKRLKKANLNAVVPSGRTVLDINFHELDDLHRRSVPAKNEYVRGTRRGKWRETFMDFCAWDMGPSQVAMMEAALDEAGYANGTINREMADMKGMYGWAIRKKYTPEGYLNPFREYEFREEPVRRVELEEGEVRALLAAAKLSHWKKLYTLVLMALHTGARKSEMAWLRWEDIDFKRRRAILHDTKAGIPRELLLTGDVVDALQALYTRDCLPDECVFSGRNLFKPHDFRRAWVKCKSMAGLEQLHFHDLRHVSCARMLKAGANTHAVASVLGHKSTRMIEARYGHLDANHLQTVVDAAWQ